MRTRIVIVAAILSISPAIVLRGQEAESSVQARNVLGQALNASGFASNPLPGFTATGTISYFSGSGKQVGTVTIKARGHDQFRMDAAMPNGTRTVSFDRAGGKRKEPNGRVMDLSAHSTLVAINPLVPYMELANALSRSDYSYSYQGSVPDGTRQIHVLRLRRIITQAQDPTGQVEDLTQADYYVDGQTLQIARIATTIAASTNITERYAQVIEFENYAGKGGLSIPTTVRLKLGGSPVWEIEISNLIASSLLTDADFTVQ